MLEEVPENIQEPSCITPSLRSLSWRLALIRSFANSLQRPPTPWPGKLDRSIEAKAKLLPKSKQNKPAPSAQVKGSQGAGKQSAVDADFNKAFPDAVIR